MSWERCRHNSTTPLNITHTPHHHNTPLSPARYTLCTSEFVFKIPDSSISNPVFSIIILLKLFVSQSHSAQQQSLKYFFRLIRLIINEVLICILYVQFSSDIDGVAGGRGAHSHDEICCCQLALTSLIIINICSN